MTESADKAPTKARGRKKGTPKTGGRQKGTRNRNSMSVLQALDKANIPIIEFLVADIQALEPGQRLDQWFRLLKFCYPQLKEIEFTPPMPPASTPATSDPTVPHPRTKEERFALIHGQIPRQPAASGK